MDGVVKRFGGTLALDRASLSVVPGEIHALLGENGSGKSTLMKVLAGIHRADAGQIRFAGAGAAFHSPLAAAHAGIAIVHQELNLVPVHTAAENLFLGREPRTRLGLADRSRMRDEARRIFDELQVDIHPDTRVEQLPVALCQMVEIARALLQRARLLILDEPTSALADSEVQVLFRVVRRLRSEGSSIVYISHKMAEVFELCDRFTVLRDGRTVTTDSIAHASEQDIIASMVGRQLGDYYPQRAEPAKDSAEILSVENLVRPLKTGGRRVNGVSFSLRRGEILGICGLVGAGRTEMLEILFGAAGADWGGTVRLGGAPIRPTTPAQAIAAGIALVTEDRGRLGVLPGLSVLANAVLPSLPGLSRFGSVSVRREQAALARQTGTMPIRRASDFATIGSLSGGNQQKVILARWLMTNPRLLLLDEPTRGIDVGAKAEIYRVLRALADSGIGVIISSSEMPEILGLADRIIVLSAGRLAGDFLPDEANEQSLLRAAFSRPVS